jgi:hypothetical protein
LREQLGRADGADEAMAVAVNDAKYAAGDAAGCDGGFESGEGAVEAVCKVGGLWS